MKKLFTVVLSGIMGVSLILGLSACSFNKLNAADMSKYTTGNAVITDKVEALDIEWASGTVEIVTGSGSEVVIEESYKGSIPDEKKMHWYLDGTTLKIIYDTSLDFFTIVNSSSKALTVTLPADLVLKDVDISVASADVKADALRCKKANLDTASGDINVTFPETVDSVDIDMASGDSSVRFGGDVGSLKADAASGDLKADVSGNVGNFDFDSASGCMELNAAGTAGSGSVSTASGKVDISLTGISDLDIDTASGSVTLYFPESASLSIDIDTASGDFNSNIPFVKSGDKYVIGSGDGEVNIDTASGDITINKR